MRYLLPFKPILAGATLRDRLFACLGALVGVGLTGLLSSLALGADIHLPLIVAPIGASAVLVFAVPASPLAQPWPVIGGNAISALVGIAVGKLVADPALSLALAAGLAIATMSLARCLHPPGGATAMTAILGGPAVAQAGFAFALVPVALNSAVLVALGYLFHKLSRHSYPHVPTPVPANTHGTADPPPQLRVGFKAEDVDAALRDAGEAFDIDRDDLDRLLRRVEQHALSRSHDAIACADIMSRDVIAVPASTGADEARRLLLDHNLRTLPVTAGDGRLVGIVGLRDLTGGTQTIGETMTLPAVARAEDPAFSLVPQLTDGRTHAVVIVNPERRILGLVTQTDLLVALSRVAISAAPARR